MGAGYTTCSVCDKSSSWTFTTCALFWLSAILKNTQPFQHRYGNGGGSWPGTVVVNFKTRRIKRHSIRDKPYKTWVYRDEYGRAWRGRGPIPRTNVRVGGFQACLEETGASLISTLLESQVENGSKPHGYTPATETGFQRSYKEKVKEGFADETFICLKNITRLKDTCNRNGSGPREVVLHKFLRKVSKASPFLQAPSAPSSPTPPISSSNSCWNPGKEKYFQQWKL